MNNSYINLDVTSIFLLIKDITEMLKQMANKEIKRISKTNIHSQVTRPKQANLLHDIKGEEILRNKKGGSLCTTKGQLQPSAVAYACNSGRQRQTPWSTKQVQNRHDYSEKLFVSEKKKKASSYFTLILMGF